jgi:NADH-quinone oxidoreductase subunit C
MTATDLAEKLRTLHPDVCRAPSEFRGELSMQVSDAARIVDVCASAKSQCGFDFLVDITSVDNYGEDPRFTIVYHLYGHSHRCYLRLKASVSEEVGEVPSVIGVWRTADWHEREAFDMMGIRFKGHPDLRRILMWDGYPFFPLRKDFPLSGKPTNLPEVAFTQQAPLEGGPFVTVAGGKDTVAREPRARLPETDSMNSHEQAERRTDARGPQVGAPGASPTNRHQ